jgi:cytochrome P450 PksS
MTLIATRPNPIPDVNVASSKFKARAYPFYARLRDEAPVYPVKAMGQPAWLITRYDDVLGLLKSEQLVKDRHNAMNPDQLKKASWGWIPGFLRALERNMLDLDVPDHTRLRGLVHQGFTPRLIERMRGRVQTLSDELIHKARKDGRMDLIHDYALPIPVTIISEMLGIPTRDRERFSRYSKAILTATVSSGAALFSIPNIIRFVSLVRRVIKQKRAHPEDDLISALCAIEESGDRLSEDELLAMIVLLIIAGHETTVNLIGNGTLALLTHPDQFERLRAEPALIKPGLEELLRFHSPVELATERYARDNLELHGVTIPKGQLVYLAIASANRDETQFSRPDRLDITREPNKHLSFGQGIHFCLGAPLARLEGSIALQTLLREAPKLTLAVTPESLRWRPGMNLRGLERLPVVL